MFFFLGLLETMGQVEGEEKIKNRGTGRLVKKTRRESTPSPLFSFFLLRVRSPLLQEKGGSGEGRETGLVGLCPLLWGRSQNEKKPPPLWCSWG